ncbi:hypothetical protein EC973_003091 [Apophysomyces ossiformis]|uniref:Uncharacterized protein n=1 Tax=Apophysomyces ossiformis TaxID=679940 RepID=A0A8H7BMX2_9FUNG|nr:hypothetical protein EC973_003091 [Apophysomyces ossiformis]
MPILHDLRFDLLTVQVKQPGSGQGQGDLQKIAQEMKAMIDSMIDSLAKTRIQSPVVCGIGVNGFECHTYKMDLGYDGIYRLIELDDVMVASSIDDLAKVKRILAALLKTRSTFLNFTRDNSNTSISSSDSQERRSLKERKP